MSKNVLILTGDAVEALEVFYPYYRCLEENINCTIASPVKKKASNSYSRFPSRNGNLHRKMGVFT